MSNEIVGAFFGDSLARRDVLKSLMSKISGGKLEVTANEELIPAFEVSEETKLTQNEVNEIDKKAQEQCSGGADTDCVRATKAKLMQQKHEEKANTDNSAANVIAGRALTVIYRDSKGNVKRAIVPDGQKFSLANVQVIQKDGTPVPTDWKEYQTMAWTAVGWAVWTAVFIFSVASSYRVFKRYGNLPIALAITVFAVLLPLGGAPPYIGILFIIAINAFLEMGRQSKAASAAVAPAPPALPANPLEGLAARGQSALQGLAANPLAALRR